ncbi:hypothetical protein NUU61_009404 [Penicillium alfredii]|uniref:Zn(2)-C6 fungal-type domain-containing protein n=1 Tax=Penicillium alfredii TaxID=1506179 RepID=A0A9W9JX84_9EURO|nr:uncharacterized protein NUU61_009404 [Penicillium alfredii]KAJ5084825.1 hypothetical protein NUU61_009404 [Penicillium alfredii]
MPTVFDRKRRVHAKSKRGCRNCKIRRVKCDEAQPQCQKCVGFGVACNYNAPHGPDLQPAQANGLAGQIVFRAEPRLSLAHPSVIVGDGPGSFQLDAESLARLDRFQRRTVLTIGTPEVCTIYKNEITSLALGHPFLMHVILTLTATHDRHMSMSPRNARRSLTEAYHWAHAARLLNQKLSVPIRPQDRDALWGSVAILGVLSLTSSEAPTPEESWPLKPSQDLDLQWINLAQNKKAIWNITDPMRPDSIFCTMAYASLFTSEAPCCDIDEIPPEFVRLCYLDRSESRHENPYFTAVAVLARLLQPPKDNQPLIPRFLIFLWLMEPAFKGLLHCKDPRALLILASWYAPLSDATWWVARRARLECQAICLYLERYHADDEDIQRLLPLPRMHRGLGLSTGDGCLSRFIKT